MANDISGAPSALLLIFKILYFARQIVPIEINPASWADSCCDNSRPSSTLYLHSRFHAKRSRARIRTLSCRPPSILPSFDPRQSPSPRSNRTTTANLILRSSNSFSIPTFPLSFHHSSPRVCSSCFTRYLPIFFHSLLTPSLSLSVSRSLDCSSIAGDRFVKLLIFFLALRPRSCHPDRAPLYPRILAFIPDVVEKYQPRCVTRLLLSLLLLFPPLFHSR